MAAADIEALIRAAQMCIRDRFESLRADPDNIFDNERNKGCLLYTSRCV